MLAPYPFNDAKKTLLGELTQDLGHDALHWLSGYFAGVAHGHAHPAHARTAVAEPPAIAPVASAGPSATPLAAAHASKPMTVLYGSQTGNAKRVAEALAGDLEAAGLPVRLCRADRYPVRELKQESLMYIVISTQGDGDPPDDSLAFMEFIQSRRAPKLPQLRYAILGLGDSSYPDFCGVARQLDKRLTDLGAQPACATAEADLDIETVALPWQQSVLAHAVEALRPAGTPASNVTPLRPQTGGHAAPEEPAWSRAHPFEAELLLDQRITASGSGHDVRHLELSLEGSGLSYQPGDALGVWPVQAPALVDEILSLLELDADAQLDHGGIRRNLREWLQNHRELTQLTRPFLQAHAQRAGSTELDALLNEASRQALQDVMRQWQVADVLRRFPGQWTAPDLIAALRPLSPRMYSIASSQAVVGDEVHLTLANVRYDRDGAQRWGVASHHLTHAGEGSTLRIFIEENSRFRLPPDPGCDMIMIGPGTGIAPFRAFIQHRSMESAPGRSWLFFGNRHRAQDFLYQTEWLQALDDGHLSRMDVAFSRDQDDKVYVQHKILERAAEVYDWIQAGAHVYVCGDALHMAKDVHQALIQVACDAGGLDDTAAKEWLDTLAAQGRYARDVY